MVRTLTIACVTAFVVALGAVTAAAQVITSGGDSIIVNGYWDSTAFDADAPGELSAEIAGVYSGIHRDSLRPADTVLIDSCYAFSSLESLQVQDSLASAYDTLFFLYYVQNQGNVTDSFTYVVTLVDTADAGSFVPSHFDLFEPDAATALPGVDSVNELTRRVGVWLAQDALDSFLVRIVVPSPLTAADEDTLRFGVNMKDNIGTGTWDAWPDTVKGTGFHSSRRYVRDTLGTWLHTVPSNNTMLDFGDNQFDTVFIAIAAPIIRLAKSVAVPAGKIRPGDTLTYTIVYDNDGSSETRDTLNIVDVLPAGLMFVRIDSLAIDTVRASADSIDVDYLYGAVSGGNWIEHEPSTVESLMRVTGLRFQVPPGVGANDTDDPNKLVADDSLDNDAGFVTFKVRVR